ncbi:MAG: glycosyltransferase family 1 protein [bacterium]|nr:glycosyltransferase family 1 protein [bacterium]
MENHGNRIFLFLSIFFISHSVFCVFNSFDDYIHKLRNTIVPKSSTKKLNVCILAYANTNEYWDPDTITTGIAGSEEAIIYVSDELSKLDCKVDVFANPAPNSVYRNVRYNPRYFDAKEIFENTGRYDVIILWRRTDFEFAKTKGNIVLFWPHDPYHHTFNLKGLDGVLWLSQAQREQYIDRIPDLAKVPSIICGNGIVRSQFNENYLKKNPYSCIYASNYAYGLKPLLDIWPEIKQRFPLATLDIYYGFQTFGLLSAQEIEQLKQQIVALKSFDVFEHGKIGHTQLAEKFMEASLWTYPGRFFETFCITALKAQIAGCIPVVIKHSGLQETVCPLAPSCSRVEEYKNLLLSAMQNIENLDRLRNEMVTFAENKTWENIARKWLRFIENIH